ncbi:MAG: hypothetical protein IJ634_04055 [Bacteroidales bacterium]|nr:hypothetical protein [Bacteroidales bacterium]
MKNRLFMVLVAVLAVAWLLGCRQGLAEERDWSLTRSECLLPMRDRLKDHTYVMLQRAAEYHGRYYCLFEYNGFFPVDRGVLMYVVDREGNVVDEMPMPVDYITYDDLFVRHDTLFYHREALWERDDFFFDTVARQWKPCPRVDDMVWEDEDYHVYTMDHGEFGQWTWFEHRSTGREYALWGVGDVMRARDTYYMVDRTLVRTLTLDQLAASEPADETRRATDSSIVGGSYSTRPSRLVQADTLYRDPRYDPYADWLGIRYDTVIEASLVDSEGLLLLVQTPQETALMRVGDSNRLVTERGLGEYYPVLRWDYAMRGMSMGGRRLLPFVGQRGRCGLLSVGADKRVEVMEMHHDIDSLPVLQEDGLERLLEYLEANHDRADAGGVRGVERALGASFLGREGKERNGYFRQRGFGEGDSVDWYYQRVDTLYLLKTEAWVRGSDQRVMAVYVGVEFPVSYYGPKPDLYLRQSYEENRRYSKWLSDVMVSRLEAFCGKPRRKGSELHYRRGPLTVVFHPDDNRLLIF